MIQNSYSKEGALYLVPTPIGNLEDMTIRAINILKSSEVIFCEDTRNSAVLLNHFEIKNKLVSLHEHNEEQRFEEIKSYLDNGKNVSLISDAGMPTICDPGYKITSELVNNGYYVISLPGANAFLTALVNSGFSTNNFVFYGFLDKKPTKAVETLLQLYNISMPACFYESPHRINNTLNLIYETLGDVNIVIARELTKKFETIYRGKVSEFIDINFRGEIVLIIDKIYKQEVDLELLIKNEIEKGKSGKEIVKYLTNTTSFNKNEIYDLYLQIKEN